MRSYAEHLPREIWLYIFTFLEGHHVVQAFSSLNSFFHSLLRSTHLQLYIRIKQNEAYEQLPQLTWSHINLQNIYSLSVGHRKANSLIQFLRWHAPNLIRLRALSIYLTPTNLYSKVQFLAIAIQQMPSVNYIHLKYIGSHIQHSNLDPLLMCIFGKESTITTCVFNFSWLNYDITTSNWSMNKNLRSLQTDEISWKNLFSLLSLTPHLYYLKATINDFHPASHQNFTFFQLRKVKLTICCVLPFVQLRIMKQTALHIQYLRLRGCFNNNDDDYFNEKVWQELLNDIKHFDVQLYKWEYSEQQKEVLRKRIRECQGKEWFTWQEEKYSIKGYITFKSTIIQPRLI